MSSLVIIGRGFVLVLILFFFNGDTLWNKGLSSWVHASTTDKAGMVTGVVVELVLTIAELWNFTEGTFSVAWSLHCTPGEMGVEVKFNLNIFQIFTHSVNTLFCRNLFSHVYVSFLSQYSDQR